MEKVWAFLFCFEEHGQEIITAVACDGPISCCCVAFGFLVLDFREPLAHAGFGEGYHWEGEGHYVVFVQEAEDGVFEKQAVEEGELADLWSTSLANAVLDVGKRRGHTGAT